MASCYRPNGQLVKEDGQHIPGCYACATEAAGHDACTCETPAMRRANVGQRLDDLERSIQRLEAFAIQFPEFRRLLAATEEQGE